MIKNNKKCIELNLTVIVTLIIAIIVLIIVIFYFIEHYGGNANNINDLGNATINQVKNLN